MIAELQSKGSSANKHELKLHLQFKAWRTTTRPKVVQHCPKRADTVNIHIGAGDLQGGAGPFRDAHVEFTERHVTVRVAARNGKT